MQSHKFRSAATLLPTDRSSMPERTLFHYTNATGLLGIVQTGQLWATHTDYVNDKQELKYAATIVEQRFAGFIGRATEVDRFLLEELLSKYLVLAALRQLVADVYIVCFCERGDQLSQ